MKNFKCSVILFFFVVVGVVFLLVVYVLDGIINFNGKVIVLICSVEGGLDFIVLLLLVSMMVLVEVGFVVVCSVFLLVFKGCMIGDDNLVKVGVIFENGMNVDWLSGCLMIDVGDKVVEGVQINVLDD